MTSSTRMRPSLCPPQTGPRQDEQNIRQVRGPLSPFRVYRLDLGLGEGVHLVDLPRLPRHPDAENWIRQDDLLADAPGEERRQARPIADHRALRQAGSQQVLERPRHLAARDRRRMHRQQARRAQPQEVEVRPVGLARNSRPAHHQPAFHQGPDPLPARARVDPAVECSAFARQPRLGLTLRVEHPTRHVHAPALQLRPEPAVRKPLDAHAATLNTQASTSWRRYRGHDGASHTTRGP